MHDKTEILLKVTLNTIKQQTNKIYTLGSLFQLQYTININIVKYAYIICNSDLFFAVQFLTALPDTNSVYQNTTQSQLFHDKFPKKNVVQS